MGSLKSNIKYILFIVGGIVLFSLISEGMNTRELPSLRNVMDTIGWTVFYSVPLYLANRFVFYLIYKNDINRRTGIPKVVLGIIISFVISILVGGFLFVLNNIMLGESVQESIDWVISRDSLESFKFLIWISGTVSITIFIFFYIISYQEKKNKEQQVKTENIATAHESLKSQIGPHFLFNSLNVLNGLIEENPDKAQEFVGDLGMIYRYVLEQNDKSLVSLRQETDFAKTYLNLVQKRYEDGLNFEFVGTVDEDVQIVPLSLQILLENCIKHNRISSSEPLNIRVEILSDRLIVKNNLQPKNRMNDSVGKGLQSIIDRYTLLTSEKVMINQDKNQFSVEIPLLKQNLIPMETKSKFTEDEYLAAKERVEAVQGFYWNLGSYVVVNLFLTLLDIIPDGRYDWAFWPLMGWGIGVFFNAIKVFGFFNNQNWEQRMIEKELEKNRQNRQKFN